MKNLVIGDVDMREKPKNEIDPAGASLVLETARTYFENADHLIYSYGSRTFLSGYDLYDREYDSRGNIDCSTFVLLVLAGIPYERSPYALGSIRGLEPNPLAELDLTCFAEIPSRYTGIAERIGRPYLAGPKGLDLDKAAELGIRTETLREEIRSSGVSRRSVSIAEQFLERDECYSDPQYCQPGDLVFYRSTQFFGDDDSSRPWTETITHVGIIWENTSEMINSSGYLSKERAMAESLPAVSIRPVIGKRSPAFFARPIYRRIQKSS